MQYGGSVYIITNVNNSVLYIGVTSNLLARVGEHRDRFYKESFTDTYNCHKLVYYQSFPRIEEAIIQEKRMKKWKREWKFELITSINPTWRDLYDEL